MNAMARSPVGTDLQCSTGPFWAFGLEDGLTLDGVEGREEGGFRHGAIIGTY
jgi:hypothetical protein